MIWEREKNICVRERHCMVAFHVHPDWGLKLQPRYQPWLGIKPLAFWCTGQCCNHLRHTGQDLKNSLNFTYSYLYIVMSTRRVKAKKKKKKKNPLSHWRFLYPHIEALPWRLFLILTQAYVYWFWGWRGRNIDVREKHQSIAFRICPKQGSNPQPFGTLMMHQPTEPPGQGPWSFVTKLFILLSLPIVWNMLLMNWNS